MTDKQKLAMMLMPNYKEFIESGDSRKASILLSMAYLTQSIANAYNEEAIELMEKHDLIHKKIKTRIVNLTTAFDLYDKEIFQLVDSQEARQRLLEDYDSFRAMCDKFMNIDEQKGHSAERHR